MTWLPREKQWTLADVGAAASRIREEAPLTFENTFVAHTALGGLEALRWEALRWGSKTVVATLGTTPRNPSRRCTLHVACVRVWLSYGSAARQTDAAAMQR